MRINHNKRKGEASFEFAPRGVVAGRFYKNPEYKKWKQSCYKKVAYKSQEEAETLVKGMKIYKCVFCPFWHVGHFEKSTQEHLIKSEISGIKYITSTGKEIKMYDNVILVKRSLNFFLKDSSTWVTEDLLKIVCEEAKHNIEEIHLANNDYIDPTTGFLCHRYDLYFRSGKFFCSTREAVNEIVRNIEKEFSKN